MILDENNMNENNAIDFQFFIWSHNLKHILDFKAVNFIVVGERISFMRRVYLRFYEKFVRVK